MSRKFNTYAELLGDEILISPEELKAIESARQVSMARETRESVVNTVKGTTTKNTDS